MEVTKLGNFGYKITNISFKEDPSQLLQLVGDGRIVVIKNTSPVNPTVLVEFYKTLGSVVAQADTVAGVGVDGYNELVRVTSTSLFAGADDGELEWHSAGMNRTGSEDIVAMYMNITSDTGGNTYFSDGQSAYNDLGIDIKNSINEIKSKTLTYKVGEKLGLSSFHKNIFYDTESLMTFKDIDGTPSFEKQVNRKMLVTTHPINNKKGLHFPWSVIRGFTGMPKEQQKELYFHLKEHTMQDKYVYTHTWDPYDIILSDQHHSLHRRDKYYGNRELFRSGIWVHNIHDTATTIN